MLLPLLLIGVVAFLAGQASKAGPPVVGALGPGAPAGTNHNGDRVRFELGRPYRIVATAAVPPEALRKLVTWLTLGTYRVHNLTVRQLGTGATELCLCFVAPKTEVVPIGQPLDWDLGDGRLRLTLRSVQALDQRPLTIGGRGDSDRLRELRAQAKAELSMSRKLGRPLGPIYARAMQRAISLQARGDVRPSELPTLLDDLRAEIDGVPDELLER